MRNKVCFNLIACIACIVIEASKAEDRCTAIAVGPKASANGASMTTHTNDCSDCDFRLAKVPAMSYPHKSRYDVALARFNYPRYVGENRGNTYRVANLDHAFYNWTETVPIGTIPQVQSTYAYIDGSYGILNEHQLAIGESTCGGRLVSKPISDGGKALFDVAALSRLAMERTKTAREAIKLMGDMAVEHGYYGVAWGESDALAEAGEALTVVDPKEAWVFHIHPDDTGASAVWVAQRVPDDEIAVVANQFVIHQVNLSDSEYFMGSDNLEEVARRQGFWDPKQGPFDFTRAYASDRKSPHHYYSTRRQWRLFKLANPSLELSPYTDPYATDYPFSVKPQRPLAATDIMRFMRDHYEGTKFDMTKGPASGPYGNPDRYDVGSNGNMSSKEAHEGHFERAISIFRASYSWVSEVTPKTQDKLTDKIWIGLYAPHATIYTPVYAQVDEIPKRYRSGSLHKYDKDTSYWANAVVGNWVSRFYIHAISYVHKVQHDLEEDSVNDQPDVHTKASTLAKTEGITTARDYLTKQAEKRVGIAHHAMTELFEEIVTVFHDGYIMSNFYAKDLKATTLFYPKWWLEQVGYFDAPYEHLNLATLTTSPHVMAVVIAATFFASFFTLLGILFGRRYYGHRYNSYSRIY